MQPRVHGLSVAFCNDIQHICRHRQCALISKALMTSSIALYWLQLSTNNIVFIHNIYNVENCSVVLCWYRSRCGWATGGKITQGFKVDGTTSFTTWFYTYTDYSVIPDICIFVASKNLGSKQMSSQHRQDTSSGLVRILRNPLRLGRIDKTENLCCVDSILSYTSECVQVTKCLCASKNKCKYLTK